MTDNKKPALVEVPTWLAKEKSIPRFFVGIPYIATERAYKIIGTGVLLKKQLGICSICGRELSNPNSIMLGIGPICAGNMGISTLSGFTEKDIEKKLHKIKINGWFPKSQIKLSNADDIDFPEIEVPQRTETGKKVVKDPVKKEIKRVANMLEIFFPYSGVLLANVKRLSGRKYHKEPMPHWSCPDTTQNQTKLKKMGFRIPAIIKEIEKKSMPEIPVHLQKILFPYQKEGVQFMYNTDGRCLIGDEMGLGKTIQALTYMEMNDDVKVTVVVCPASLKLNWAKEISKWMTSYNLYILQGKKNITQETYRNSKVVSSKLTDNTIIIINYDIIAAWLDVLLTINIDLLVGDEIHFIKNQKAQRTVATVKLGKAIQRFIGLSGTPIVNRPVEFFNALNLIDGGLFGSFWNYTKHYCGAVHRQYGWDFSGASNTEELHEIVSQVMIRRKKKDVLKELPPKIRTVVPMEIDNRADYEATEEEVQVAMKTSIYKKIKDIQDSNLPVQEEREAIQKAENAKKAEAMVLMEKLKQKAVKGKMKACIKWIQDYLETEDKLVVFAMHTEVLEELKRAFDEQAVTFYGKTPGKQRDENIDSFQNDPKIKLFLGNIKAAGVGITLTAANATCFLEFPWTPGDAFQAEDRVHRIGQTADSVHAYYLAGVATVDEDIMELLDSKKDILDSVLDGKISKQKSLSALLRAKLLKRKTK